MKYDAVDVYVCPSCKGRLVLHADVVEGDEILDGALTCGHCRMDYAITRGVPRFVGSGAYASTFGRQWNWFRTVQLDSANGSTESADTFASTTGWRRRDVEGRTVLDAGVGAGRFAECVADLGGRVFGVDLTEAVDAAYKNIGARPGVYIAQADIFALPFRPGAFDCAYSIGVLHHTPDTERAFAAVASTVRIGGQFAVYLYDRYGAWYRSSNAIRRVTTRLPTRAVLAFTSIAIPLYYVYFIPGLGRLLRNAFPISPAPSWRWRWLDTFDWYSPKYQWKFLYPEVFRWFRKNGFRDVELFDGPIRMRGLKASVRPDIHERDSLSELVAS